MNEYYYDAKSFIKQICILPEKFSFEKENKIMHHALSITILLKFTSGCYFKAFIRQICIMEGGGESKTMHKT